MIKLTRIIEQQTPNGQYYDLGRDFANFKRTVDGADQQVKQRFEQSIGTKLNGKRVRAQASRGYKQYIKTYEFDVARITIDDYYGNYVVVAHDNSTPKSKEYFLKSGFKVTILGAATGQPSPQKGGKPDAVPAPVVSPLVDPNAAQSQPMVPAPAGRTPSEEQPLEEKQQSGMYDAYSVESITNDIKKWLPRLLKKPDITLRDYIKGLGWLKQLQRGTTVAMFELKIPDDALKMQISQEIVQKLLSMLSQQVATVTSNYRVTDMKHDESKEEWQIRILKTMTDTSVGSI